MTVTIEIIRKIGTTPCYYVTADPYPTVGSKAFSFKDDAPEDSIWNQEKSLKEAREYALLLKNGITESRELIETL